MSFAAMTSTALAVLIFGFFLLLNFYIRSAVLEEAKKVQQIRVFLRNNVSEERAKALQRQIQHWSDVHSVQFVHKDDGLKQLQKSMGNRLSLRDLAGGNPLPHRLDVWAISVDKVPKCARRLRDLPGVDRVVYLPGLVMELMRLLTWLKIAGLIITIAMGFATLALVSNTIRLTVYARREAIRIMQLVGATLWFIRAPFVLEGIVYGGIGGVTASIILWIAHTALVQWTENNKALLVFFQMASPGWQFFTMLAIAGTLFGFIGALIAARQLVRYVS